MEHKKRKHRRRHGCCARARQVFERKFVCLQHQRHGASRTTVTRHECHKRGQRSGCAATRELFPSETLLRFINPRFDMSSSSLIADR